MLRLKNKVGDFTNSTESKEMSVWWIISTKCFLTVNILLLKILVVSLLNGATFVRNLRL